MAALDFPAAPINGQVFTGLGGINWVWDGAKWNPGTSLSAGQFLPLAGGTMVGPIVLPGPPTLPLQAASKAYVDNAIANSAVVVSDTAPTLTNGFLWFNSADTQLYIGYNDGNSSQWVVANNLGVSDGPFLPLTGGTLTGNLAIGPASGDAALNIQAPASGAASVIVGLKGTLSRWKMFLGNGAAESTGNAGSDFVIVRSNDAGTDIDVPLTINRATGDVTIARELTSNFALSVKPVTGGATLVMQKVAASDEIYIYGMRGNTPRWRINLADANPESGSNAGSNFSILRFTDAGAAIDSPFSINRATGLVDVPSGAGLWVGDHNVFTVNNARLTVASNNGLAAQIANWSTSGTSLLVAVSQFTTAFQFFYYWNGSGFNACGTIVTNNGNNCFYNTSSDGRLKTDIVPLTDAGAIIDQLQPVSFRWQSTPDEPSSHGFIAQDVYGVYPQPVSPGNGLEPDEEGFQPWGMDNSHLVPLMMAEIKSLRARVATLEGAP